MSLFNYEYSVFDFPDDADNENGNYDHICLECGEKFVGDKSRFLCKKCDEKLMRELGGIDE